MEPIKKECIFCELPGNFKGEEHLISRWILKKLNALKVVEPWSRQEISVADDGSLIYTSTDKRVANHDSLRSGFVCDNCNSDLNLQLEIPFQRIVPSLITYPVAQAVKLPEILRAPNPLTTLSDDERQLIARWAAKTTCVIESVTPGRKEEENWIEADSKQIRTSKTLPFGWAVFGMLHEPTRPTFITGSRTWIIEKEVPEGDKELLRRLPRTIIQVGSLILLTIYLGDSPFQLQAVNGLHYPIISNLPIDWLDSIRYSNTRGTPDEPINSTVNLSFRFADTLSLIWR